MRTVTALLQVAIVLSNLCGQAPAADPPPKPNIIFVLADDLGWSEPGCYGNGFNETPHIDRLAKDGVRFTHAYAAAPVCSPYRAALLTGQHPGRIGILDYLRPNSANALSEETVTLPEMLRQHGYATGMIGKWHLTGYRYHNAEHEVLPSDHGFTSDFAREVKSVGNGANFWPYVFRTQPVRWLDIPTNRFGDDEYLVDRMNAEAVDFIEQHREQPFFLFLSHYATHSILNGKPEVVARYRRKHAPGKSTRERCYLCQDHGHAGDSLNHWAGDHNPHLAAMLESIDDGIGAIRKKLIDTGLAENTIIIFTSDNGGETNVTSNAPLRGGKSQLYEGGVRVPQIVCWPGHTPPGSVSSNPTVNTDFYPTLLEAAGIKPADDYPLDGQSVLSNWTKPTESAADRSIYWHYPLNRPHFLGGRSAGSVRRGDWKLIQFFDSRESELYNLARDPGEKHNRFGTEPEVASRLSRELSAWRSGIQARTPSPTLLSEPRTLLFADHFAPTRISSRWFFNSDWVAEGGELHRVASAKENSRIFLKDTRFRDAVVRFDFRLQDARDIRLVTGSNGPYNAVVHIRPDHFFIQTAKDPAGPWFSYRHGECAFEFDPQRWYSMTVEFVGDRLVAHIDRDHVAFAQHPILKKERTYFAFQADRGRVSFDNVQMFTAGSTPSHDQNMQHIVAVRDAHPVTRPLDEALQIAKTNAHERLFQNDAAYRALVEQLDRMDDEKKRLFPDVFRSHKEFRKKIAEERKRLHKNDDRYRELLFTTHRTRRAMDAWLVAQQASVGELPDSRRKHAVEKLRQKYARAEAYLELERQHVHAQTALESAYPQLFITDEEITESRNERRRQLNENPEFQKLVHQRADAWRAQQEYLYKNDKQLKELQRQKDEK